MTDDPFGIGSMFGGPRHMPAKPEKGVQLHGRKIGDTYYVRAADVAELLELNAVLPKAAARLRAADQ